MFNLLFIKFVKKYLFLLCEWYVVAARVWLSEFVPKSVYVWKYGGFVFM